VTSLSDCVTGQEISTYCAGLGKTTWKVHRTTRPAVRMPGTMISAKQLCTMSSSGKDAQRVCVAARRLHELYQRESQPQHVHHCYAHLHAALCLDVI